MQKTVIDQEAFLIEVEFEGQHYRLLWGVVLFDETGRRRPGDYVCTTPIQEIEDQGEGEGVTRYLTRSGRTYETRCEVTPFKATPHQANLFVQGGSPGELKILESIGHTVDGVQK